MFFFRERLFRDIMEEEKLKKKKSSRSYKKKSSEYIKISKDIEKFSEKILFIIG